MTSRSKTKNLILIAEDELALGDLLMFNLQEAGFTPELAQDGRLALLRLRKDPLPDLMLLDWMLPGPSGIEICKAIRKNSTLNKMPIIMLTARSEEKDIVKGFEAGVDDYLTKPFSMKVLAARIEALLRRTNRDETIGENESALLQFGQLKIDANNYRVLWQNGAISLSPTGFRLLLYFASNADKVLTRENILDAVWGQDSIIDLRTVDTAVKRVRDLLTRATGKTFIKTEHGFGYIFEAQTP